MALTKISSNLVADDAIVTGKIADGGVATADLAANAVTTAKIAQNNVTAHHIADGSVTTTQLGADSVTNAKIADDAISEEHLDKTIISDLTEVTAVSGDFLIIGDTSDSNNLKKAPISSLPGSSALPLAGGTMTGNLVVGGSGFTTTTINSTRTSGNIGGINFSASGTNKAQIYGTVDGQLKLGTGGDGTVDSNLALTLDTAGKVGIGTASPSQLLHVDGHAAITSAYSLMFGDGGERISGNNSTEILNFFTGATERMRIDSSGNVGIGTTDIGAKLSVRHAAAAGLTNTAAFSNDQNAATTGDGAMIKIHCTSDENRGVAIANVSETNYATNNSLVLYTSASSTLAERMRIDSSGNVGIGMTPTGVLDIKSDGGDDIINIVHSGNTVKLVSLGQSSDNSGNGVIQLRRNNGTVHSQIHSHGDSYFNGGDVGIGTTSPAQTLHTSGTGVQRIQIDATDNNAAGAGLYMKVLNSGSLVGNATVRVDNTGNLDIFTGTSSESQKMTILAGGDVGIGTSTVPINDSGGPQPLYLTMHKDAGNLIELSADHSASGELIGGIDFTNDNNADAANNDADGKLVALMRARTYTDDSNASDDSGGVLQFATKDDGGVLAERLKINETGEIQIKGQYNSSGNSQFAYKTVFYQFDMDSGGTHYLEVPLYSSYSSSNSSGWAEMDIAWLPDHASHTHLHSYKFMWGSNHTRVLNLGVISATANETSASYGPYNITSKSQLFRHPTAGDANMAYLYIKLQGYHSVNKRRVITLRGVASADVNTASIGPVIDHGSTEPVANMVSVNAEIESA